MTATIQKCVVKGNIAGLVQIRNIYHAQVQVSGPSLIPTIWTEYLDGIYVPLEQLISPLVSQNSFEVYELSGGLFLPIGEYEYTNVGSETLGDLMPNLVAAVITGKAGATRSFGRKFFSGLTELFLDGNSVAGSALTQLAEAALAYVTTLDGLNGVLQPGIYDKNGNFRAFATGLVSSLLGTMRRRKPGLGI